MQEAAVMSSRKPAVPIEQSVTATHIVCLEDGAKVKALAPYIKRRYQLTPEQYRARWSLPDDYPMVPPG
jgi:predicted transcriptional regulator